MDLLARWAASDHFGWTLVLANVPVYFLVGYAVFGNWGKFFKSIYYCIRPDMWSRFAGDYVDDVFSSLTMVIYLGACGLITGGQWHWLTGLAEKAAG